MSTVDIADNKWELESTKPPVTGVAAYGQIGLMGLLGLLFAYVIVMSLVAIVTPKSEETLGNKFKNLNAAPAGAEAPAAPAP